MPAARPSKSVQISVAIGTTAEYSLTIRNTKVHHGFYTYRATGQGQGIPD